MKDRQTPLSERVQALDGAGSDLIREVQMLERTASGEIMHGAANGRSPKDWSVERWLLIIGFTGTLFYQVFGLGVTFTEIRRDVSIVQRDMTDVRDELSRHVRRHEQEIQQLREQQPTEIVVPRPRPLKPEMEFPRDERFGVGQ